MILHAAMQKGKCIDSFDSIKRTYAQFFNKLQMERTDSKVKNLFHI